jgi:hypothetical protein
MNGTTEEAAALANDQSNLALMGAAIGIAGVGAFFLLRKDDD